MTTTPATAADVRGRPDKIIVASYLAGYGPRTRGHYALVLKQWARWCREHDLELREVKRAHIELWARHLDEQLGLMNSTIVGKLTTVCGLYRYAQKEGFIEGNPGLHVKRPPVPTQSTTNELSQGEVYRLLALAEKTDVQDHAVLATFAFTGMRVGELCALKIEDLGEKRGQPIARIFREKVHEPAEVPLVPRVVRALRIWTAGRTSGPLFLLNNGKPMDDRGANRIVKRYAKAVGIDRRITCHSFRHTFVTISLDGGASHRDVQHSVGHKDLRSLSRYDHSRHAVERNSAFRVAAMVEAVG